MKGDLSTLKKVCLYGSKVMMAGCIILAIVIAAIAVLGIGSLVNDGMSDALADLIKIDPDNDPASEVASAYLEVLIIFILALVTVWTTYTVMVSIHTEHSPFTDGNHRRVKTLSQIYLGASVVFLALEGVKNLDLATMSFMFFGCILLSVVLYIFALMIRYGALLQDESDHTL